MIEKLGDRIAVYEDKYGSRVLYCHSSIPTFDSADREWDSAFDEYIMYDGNAVNLITSREGYKIARLDIYKNLLSVEPKFESYFRQLEFPVNKKIYR